MSSIAQAAPTLILHPRYDTDSQLMWQAAIDRGWPVVRTASYLAHPIESTELVVYGGYMWAEAVAQTLGVPLQAPADDWLVWTRRGLTLRGISRLPVRDINRFPMFVKSLRGKSIASRVYHSADDFPPGSVDEEVLVQDVVRWNCEYRAFVLDGVVRTISRYAIGGKLDVGPEEPFDRSARAVATAAAKEVGCYAVVVDVGCMEGRGWGVVELNPAWCSAIYACDPSAVLDVVAESCGVNVERVVR